MPAVVGRQVFFNVCYALASHRVAAEHNLPLPTFPIVDSPTKNISSDVNPELVANYFKQLHALAEGALKNTQFILSDSDWAQPQSTGFNFTERLLSREDPLIAYCSGP